MKIAVVGLGYWGPKLLRNLVGIHGEEDVVAVDSQRDRREAVRRSHTSVRFVETLEQALDCGVTAVLIATPLRTHSALGRQALEAGCHVLMEKPLAASTAEAIELTLLAEKNRRVLMVSHTFLFSPRVNWLAEYIKGGGIGKVHYLTSSRLNLGLHRSDTNVIWDLAPHDFSILLHLTGEVPTSVRAVGRDSTGSGKLDVAFITLHFPSGVVASVELSWLAPKKIRSTVAVGDLKMAVYDDNDNEAPIKIYDRGLIRSDSPDFGQHQLIYRFGDTVAPYISSEEPLTSEIEHFLECTNGRTSCVSDGWCGVQVVALLEAAERSHRKGGMAVDVQPVGKEAHLDGRHQYLGSGTGAR